MRLFLVRHGQTILNALGRTQGWADAPLTPIGEATARSVGAGLAVTGVRFESAHAADMMRHGQTARLILDAMGDDLPLQRTVALRETAFGGYEGAESEAMWAGIGAALGEGPERPLDRHGIAVYLDALRDSNPVPQIPAEGVAEASPASCRGSSGSPPARPRTATCWPSRAGSPSCACSARSGWGRFPASSRTGR